MAKYLKAKKEIRATSLTIYFNYSFLFSSFNLESLINSDEKKNKLTNTISEKMDVEKESIKVFYEDGEYYKEKEVNFDYYLAPFLCLKMSYIEISDSIISSPINGQIKIEKWDSSSKDANQYCSGLINLDSIKRKIFIMESGQGIETIEMQFSPTTGNFISPLDIVYLSNIGMRREKFQNDKMNRDFSEFRLVRNGVEFFLFNFFFEDISNLREGLGELIFLNDGKKAENGYKFKWIETDNKYKLAGDVEKYGSRLHFQDPFPVISITVSDDIYADCFLDEDQRKAMYKMKTMKIPKLFERNNSSMNKELLMFLYRSKHQFFQDISYAKDSNIIKNDKLVNMCSNLSVFLHLYSRSGLIVRTQNTSLRNHAEYIIPAFIETIQYLRMRWHAYVVASQWLEKIIENLSGNNTDFKETLKEIIDSKRDISRALSDPISYRLGSGSMNKIYEMGLNIFRINEIQKIVLGKFDMIETLYGNLFEYERAIEIQQYEEEIKRIKDKILHE